MIEIIPAIDLIDGKCVRLTRGDYSTSKTYGDPLDMALMFQDNGLRRLHLVDLDGAREGHIVNYRILEKIALKTSLVIDAGGGIKTDKDLRIVFESGASMATGGSIAVKSPELFQSWVATYGSDRIILGSDFRDGMISVSGWTEDSNEELIPFLESWTENGIKKTICTDVSKDGVLEGPALETYKEIRSKLDGLELIASGGVSSIDDVIALDEASIPGVIIGKAIYEGKIELNELAKFVI